jgi:hypothetical protein
VANRVNPYEEVEKLRQQCKAMEARAKAAELKTYDAYMQAILNGLCTRAVPPRRAALTPVELLPGEDAYGKAQPRESAVDILDEAERLTIRALRARKRYYAGLSPNEPPKPQLPKKTEAKT